MREKLYEKLFSLKMPSQLCPFEMFYVCIFVMLSIEFCPSSDAQKSYDSMFEHVKMNEVSRAEPTRVVKSIRLTNVIQKCIQNKNVEK